MLIQTLHSTDSFTELRAVKRPNPRLGGDRKKLVVTQRYRQGARVDTWAKQHSDDGWDVYFGIAARTQDGDFLYTHALWVDLDAAFPLVLSVPPPSATVVSGRGRHLYWFLANPLEDVVLTRKYLQMLTRLIGADPASAEPMHLLRVPGTRNFKYDPPIPVLLVDNVVDRKYEITDFSAYANLPPEVLHTLHTTVPEGRRSELDWATINELVKHGLSDTCIQAIYETLPIGDKAREKPGYLTLTLRKARARTQAQETDPTTDEQTIMPPITSAQDSPLIPPVDHAVIAKSTSLLKTQDGYIRIQNEEVIALSNFTFEVLAVQEGDSQDLFVVNVHQGRRRVRTNFPLPVGVLTEAKVFSKHLGRAGLIWFGNDLATRKLHALLYEEWGALGYPRILVTNQLGRNFKPSMQSDVFVTDNYVYRADLSITDEVVYVSPSHEHPNIDYNFNTSNLMNSEELAYVLRSIVEVNQQHVIAPILGWFVAAHLKPVFEHIGIRFPHLLVYGSRGAGKTTLITRVFQPLAGYMRPITWQANSTPFVLLTLLGSTTSVPICLTEFRESTQRYQARFLQFLRTAYDFGRDARGHADLSTTQYNLSAPICIDGEDNVNDPALLERIVSVYLDVRDIPRHRDALYGLDTEQIRRAGATLAYACMQISEEDAYHLFRVALDAVNETHGNDIAERVRHNQAVALCGLLLIERLVNDTPFPINPRTVELYFGASMDEVVGETLGRTVMGVDNFVEDVCNHVIGAHIEGSNAGGIAYRYKPDRDGQVVAFHLKTAYAWWRKQQISLQAEVPSLAMIKKQLREQEDTYVIEAKPAQTQFGRVMRLYHIDLIKAGEMGLDIDLQ